MSEPDCVYKRFELLKPIVLNDSGNYLEAMNGNDCVDRRLHPVRHFFVDVETAALLSLQYFYD